MSTAPCDSIEQVTKAMFAAETISVTQLATSQGKPPPPNEVSSGKDPQPPDEKI